ncbi:hypothetical protein LTR37_018978 [Vermiconidia calcicola]|uniref:Uncharacterized protein n=1 Tax=Vermiconidia calcicola TaxID=1690605 RepID=A0ACC3MFL9_9PEZI|nr:hypothetical protein LTR37_018978 [Vermiconidia calcicola]
MGFFRTATNITGWGSLGSVLGYVAWTRHSKINDLPPTDYLFNTTIFSRFNPYNNPAMADICTRKVKLEKIRPELLEQEGKLVEAFSAGVWSGWGFAYQRRFLEKKYRGPNTASHLWERKDFQASTYETGTMIADHFEVVAKSENSIIIRCGDSPRIDSIRESDGLFELTAEVKQEEGVVEFGMKSAFYNGIAQPDKEGKPLEPPVQGFTKWLHQHYDRVLMETAIGNCMV